MANPKRHSKPVDWADALNAELVGDVIPPHALSVKSLYAKYRKGGGKLTLRHYSQRLSERKDLVSAKGTEHAHVAMFYWKP